MLQEGHRLKNCPWCRVLLFEVFIIIFIILTTSILSSYDSCMIEGCVYQNSMIKYRLWEYVMVVFLVANCQGELQYTCGYVVVKEWYSLI